MRDIENLDCSAEFNAANFGVIKYTDSRGRRQRAYLTQPASGRLAV